MPKKLSIKKASFEKAFNIIEWLIVRVTLLIFVLIGAYTLVRGMLRTHQNAEPKSEPSSSFEVNRPSK